MSENNNKPVLRFKGFNDSWKQHKFEDILKLSQGLQIPISQRFLTEGENKYFYITNEFLKSTCDVKYYIENPSQSVICTQEDILMTRTGNTGIVVTDVEGCFHNNFFKIQYDKELFDKYFIVKLLSTESMKRRILNSAGSSTIPDLSHKSFYKLDSHFPEMEEQEKIAELFIKLDYLINLNQNKLDKLTNLKKAMLDKMFPKNGEKVPEVRFKGFTDNWEQCKIGNLFEKVESGNRLPKIMLNKGTIPYVIAKKNNNGIFMRISNDTRDFHDNELKLFSAGSITFSIDNPDAIFYQKEPFFTSNIMRVLFNPYLSENQNIFILEALRRLTNNFNWSIKFSGPVVINSLIFMPLTIEKNINWLEIEKIGLLFKDLDNLIALQEKEITKLKNIKKSCLNKMFV